MIRYEVREFCTHEDVQENCFTSQEFARLDEATKRFNATLDPFTFERRLVVIREAILGIRRKAEMETVLR